MDKTVEKIIQQAQKDPVVIAVAFFGSYARGEPHRDVDVCIFLKPAEYSPQFLSSKKLQFTPEEEKYDVQIFQQLPLYIQKRILKEARILYCKNEDLLYDLYFLTIRDFEHYEHIYETYLEAVESG
ncbi:MAG: nucleotidyltransferase domain-containing protein [Nanoarchaeota archaeon]